VRLRSEGKSWREIAAALGVPLSTVTVSLRIAPKRDSPGGIEQQQTSAEARD
jgi:hypothetical protein